jgi:hypothetical protein
MNLQKNDIMRYILRRYSIDELESILNQKLNNQSRNLKHYADKSLDKFMNIVVYSITDEILEQLTDGWVEESPIPEIGLYEFIQEIFGERIMRKYDELTSKNIQESIRRILREESSRDLSPIIKRMLDLMVVKSNKDIVCKIEVKHPDNRTVRKYQEEPFTRYRVDITFIGGFGSEYWPRTQNVLRMYDNVADSVWDLIYDYMGKSVDIFHNYKTKCD